MKSLAFQSTRGILSELGSTSRVGALLADNFSLKQNDNILLVTDPGILKYHLAHNCLKGLEEKGFKVKVYSDVVGDPPERCALEAAELSKINNCKAVVGFGGGSSMDVAKVAAFLGHRDCKQEIKDIYGVGMCKGSRLPLIQVPSTAGTGSEVTNISIMTTGEKMKMGAVSSQLYADWAVLDGSITVGLPKNVTNATGVDAMVHAIEAYTSKRLKNDLSDLLAREALRLLSSNIREVCNYDVGLFKFNDKNKSDPFGVLDIVAELKSTKGALKSHKEHQKISVLQARQQMLLGSMYAGMSFSNAPVAGVHALAYPVGALFKVPHGLSNALVMLEVLKFNCGFNDYADTGMEITQEFKHSRQQYSELAATIFPDKFPHFEELKKNHDVENPSTKEYCNEFIEELEKLLTEVGMVLGLKSVGISTTDVKKLAVDSMKQTRLLQNNPREITKEDAEKIYHNAL